MTILSIRSFGGEIPRLPPERLPDGAAELAINCDLAHGELRSLDGPAPKIRTTGAVRSLFTDDGLRFFAWDKPTRAYLSPTIGDIYDRVYFANADGFRVTQAGQMQPALQNPRPPAQSWKVGVTAPALITAHTEPATSWAGDPDAQLSFKVLVKAAGAVVNTVDPVAVVTETPWKSYLVTVPEGLAEVAVAADPIPVAADGYIVVPGRLYAYRGETWVDTTGDGTSTDVDDILAAGVNAKIDAEGYVWPYPYATQPTPRAPATKWKCSLAWYNGIAWDPKDLFVALRDGTANATAAAATTVEKTLGFRLIISNPSTGQTYVDQEIKAQDVGQNQYRIILAASTVGGLESETIAYTAVSRNQWGEESTNVSPVLVERLFGEQVRIVVTCVPGDADGEMPITDIAVYRTYPSQQSSDYLLLPMEPEAVEDSGHYRFYSFVDAMPSPQSSTVLQSVEWDKPPSDLQHLTYAGNGAFCGASGRDLCLSEPYHPHAWPYRMTFPHAIVGVVAVEGGVLVTTTAQPYLVYGAHPEQMSQQAINAEQAGWGGRSMARVEGAAVFASNDGLVSVAGGQASMATSQELFTRKDWRAAFGAVHQNLMLSAWDGMLLGAVDPSYPLPGQAPAAFLLRMDEAPGYSRLVLPDGAVVGVAVSATTDELYVGYANGFAELGAGEPLVLTWKSRVFEYPRPVAFAAAVIDCTGEFMVSIYADGQLVHNEPVSARTPFRLPPVTPALRWQVAFEGTGTVRSFEMGASFRELQNG